MQEEKLNETWQPQNIICNRVKIFLGNKNPEEKEIVNQTNSPEKFRIQTIRKKRKGEKDEKNKFSSRIYADNVVGI